MIKDLSEIHKPVLVYEILDILHITPEDKIIDATLGAGGHTLEFLKKGAKTLSLETDPKMLKLARKRIGDSEAILEHANFIHIKEIAHKYGFSPVKGILFDLGISSFHLDEDERGFSFKNENAPLDMRLDPGNMEVKASTLLNVLREDQLKEMFMVSMPPATAKKLAQKICEKRKNKNFSKMGDLTALFAKRKPGKIHPATRAIMALRIAVNSELENLTVALDRSFDLLGPKGKIVVISFHSGEDRIVKNRFKSWEKLGWGLGQGPIKPSEDERVQNPRSRSAVMRVFEKNFS